MRANYKVELSSGIFLLMGIAALLWLATEATDYGMQIGDDTYKVTARFANVADLKTRAPVKIGGVTIGLVESIKLDPVDFDAIVEMQIDSRFADIPNDSGASVLTSGVLGDRYIGLDPGGALEALTDGDEIFVTQPAVVIETLISKYLFNSDKGDEK
ncbi:MAG: outer membrane lipid asymmetry maintenance protein MlaD [Gammaproteobacteria bacterium]|nr:outer membrane lipid asymmetry maintenance protein MlaD [Gammaproteobacteria bacterium]MBT8076339.1 outer membrane lipid asymmetry maintenance protein MlaD [Gammaproteobacteria bacterium]NNK97984.1 outer membrane lipid asymmetry maintenance protein MlaD [Xanthomonadales bacterium]